MSPEFDFDGFDLKTDELDDSENESIEFKVPMAPREAGIRTQVAERMEGVRFHAYTNEEYLLTFGRDSGLPEGRLAGIIEAESEKLYAQYHKEVQKLDPYGTAKKTKFRRF